MKKNILFVFAALCAIMVAFSSCSKDTEGLTRITYYPSLEIKGESYMIIDKGSVYTDEGCTAILNGVDVSDYLLVVDGVDTSKSGVYTVTYTAFNADGFSKTATRTVVVLDPNDAVEGFYMTDAESYRISSTGVKTVYGDSYEILVLNNGDGTYDIDDILGGYYAQRAGYGDNYKLDGIVTIADDGTMGLKSSYIPGWGDSASALVGKFDSATKTFTMQTTYVNMNFYVTMTKE